jgi:hypothetical protein
MQQASSTLSYWKSINYLVTWNMHSTTLIFSYCFLWDVLVIGSHALSDWSERNTSNEFLMDIYKLVANTPVKYFLKYRSGILHF